MVYQSSSRSLLTFGRKMMARPYITRTGLQMLPVELICMILENLEMPDLINCALVSKFIKKTIKESSRLNYTIELGKNRMMSILPSTCNPSFATRLNLLRSREVSWKYLKFKQRRVLNFPAAGSVYEFVGGLYGNGREDETRATASISFLELPSLDTALLGNSQDELKVWTHPMDAVSPIDFTMDPAQDLLVLVALAPPDSKWVYELHLRSIRTNRPHPRAPISIFHCLSSVTVQPMPSEIVAAVRVQVFGDLVALLIKEVFESTGAHLEIWNWVNGSYSCAMFQRTGIDDFTFLTRDSFLLVRPAGRFEVYDFTVPFKGHTIPIHRLSYAFPTLSEDYIYWYISMSSNPAPGYIPGCQTDVDDPGTILRGGRQLYYPTPEDRIHACCVYILNPTNEEDAIVHSFVFFVNLKTLLHPPPEWLTQHCLSRRRKTRVSRREALIYEANQISEFNNNSPANPTTSVPTQGSSYTSPSTSSSNNTNYSQFPVFDPPPLLAGMPNNQDTRSPSATVIPTTSSSFSSASSRVHSSSASSHRNQHTVTIPWKVWGPQSTRWFEECLSTDWQHAVYGSRTVESLRPEHHPQIYKPSSGNGSSSPASAENQDQATAAVDLHDDDDNDPDTDTDDDGTTKQGRRSSSPKRYVRIRNFNSFVFKDRDLLKGGDPSQASIEDEDSSGDQESGPRVFVEGTEREDPSRKTRWNTPRLITEPSTTPVKGVFTHDIVSWLPYTEVISEDTYEVTDVMMDDRRLLLLKRGRAGRLKRVEVLMT